MALRNLKPRLEDPTPFPGVDAAVRSQDFSGVSSAGSGSATQFESPYDALQELLAFAALSQDAHSRTALASMQRSATDARREFPAKQFDLDEVLQLIAEHAIAITGADGAAIAIAQSGEGEDDGEIVLRASAGTITPDKGAQIDRDSAFSGACIRTGEMVSCDDTEIDPRVNRDACRQLGARSMVAVPLEAGGTVFGVIEVFSAQPAAFTSQHFRNVILLAELMPGTLTPEDEARLTESANVTAAKQDGTSMEVAASVEAATCDDTPVIAEESAAANAVPADPDFVVPDPNGPSSSGLAHSVADGARPAESLIQSLEQVSAQGVLGEPVLDAMRAAAMSEPIPSLETPVPERRTTTRRPGARAFLICAGIAVVLVAGIWWMRSKHTPLMQKARSKAAQESATTGAIGQTAVATARATPKNATVAKAGAAADAGLPVSGATSQELQKFPRVTGILPTSGADSTTVVINLENQISENQIPENQVRYESHRLTGPDRIYFDLPNTQLPRELSGKSIEFHDAFLKRIRAAQPVAGLTRIVLETHGAPVFSTNIQMNPWQLVIELHARP